MNCNDTLSTLFCGRQLPDFVKLVFLLLCWIIVSGCNFLYLFRTSNFIFTFRKILLFFVNGKTIKHVCEISLYVDKLDIVTRPWE